MLKERCTSDLGMPDRSNCDLRTLLEDAAEIQLVAALASEHAQRQRLTPWNPNQPNLAVTKVSLMQYNFVRLICAMSVLSQKRGRVQASVPLSANVVTAGSWNDWSGIKQLFL